MKKVLALLLSFVVAAGAFALDLGNGLTIAGEVKTGLAVYTADDGNDKTDNTWVEPRNEDYGGDLRVRTTFAYENDAGGAKIRLQSRHWAGNEGAEALRADGYFTARYAYGWLNMLNKQIRLSAGFIGDDVWGLGKVTNVFDPAFDNDIGGVRAQFKFVDGLDFGLALPLSSLNGRAGEDAPEEPVWPLVGEFLGGAVIGGLYTSDAFKVVAALKLIPEISATKRGAPDGTDPIKGYVDVIGGVEVPLGDLTLAVNARLDTRKRDDLVINEVKRGKNGYTRIGPKVVYTTGAITAHAQGDIWLPNDSDYPAEGSPKTDKGSDPTDPSAGSTTAIAFRIGGEYAVSDTIAAYAQLGSDNISFMDYHGLYLKPGVKFTFGGSSIEIFDKISYIGADGDKYNKTANQLQIDFNLSF